MRRKAIRSRVVRHTIVPERHIALVPLKPCMYLWTRGNDLVEQADDVIALCLRDANDLGDEARVEEDRLPARDGVRADQRVFGGDWFTSYGAAEVSCSLCLKLGGM